MISVLFPGTRAYVPEFRTDITPRAAYVGAAPMPGEYHEMVRKFHKLPDYAVQNGTYVPSRKICASYALEKKSVAGEQIAPAFQRYSSRSVPRGVDHFQKKLPETQNFPLFKRTVRAFQAHPETGNKRHVLDGIRKTGFIQRMYARRSFKTRVSGDMIRMPVGIDEVTYLYPGVLDGFHN